MFYIQIIYIYFMYKYIYVLYMNIYTNVHTHTHIFGFREEIAREPEGGQQDSQCKMEDSQMNKVSSRRRKDKECFFKYKLSPS